MNSSQFILAKLTTYTITPLEQRLFAIAHS
jgi:hypothetical protein